MKPGTRFNAIRKSTGQPVMVRKFENGRERTLGEFTVVQLCSMVGEYEYYEATTPNNILPKCDNGDDKPYQLFTRFFDFHKVNKSAI